MRGARNQHTIRLTTYSIVERVFRSAHALGSIRIELPFQTRSRPMPKCQLKRFASSAEQHCRLSLILSMASSQPCSLTGNRAYLHAAGVLAHAPCLTFARGGPTPRTPRLASIGARALKQERFGRESSNLRFWIFDEPVSCFDSKIRTHSLTISILD